MDKRCGCCKEMKKISEFFNQSQDARAGAVGTSAYCKQCHAEGKIKHGYGWYGDKYRTPDETPICQ